MKRRLITSALPYVNNVPHLGNIIQVLSADVFARFCRSRGYDTLYVCGTDEYGTATETKAREEGVTPQELCDRFHALHKGIYDWFEVSFDEFGRTSTPEQTEIVQDIFKRLDSAGYIKEREIEQLYCPSCERFLADRYVRGVCPHCGYEEARGDQCEHCGKLLEPTELKEPRCSTCGSTPSPRKTRHLYIDLPAILPRLEAWMKEASVRGFWSNNAIQMTQAWIRDGLHERCITRDLKWGIPVPKKGFEDKVFYVWFDAPIGYLSITARHTPDWKSWWMAPGEVELFQFIGKDNIPFHTVIFPSSLIGDGRDWTFLHHMSSTEYLNYEGTKFSKSKGIGVFGNDAVDSGIPADVWRFYIYYNRPEKSDVFFVWSDFKEKVNGELIGNLGNLVNRTLTFIARFYEGKIPEAPIDQAFLDEVRKREGEITACLDRADLRDAFHLIFGLSSLGNKAFQDAEPWKARTQDPGKATSLLRGLAVLLKDIAILIEPYLPATAEKIGSFLGFKPGRGGKDWSSLGKDEGLSLVKEPGILFRKLEDEEIALLKERYSGTQKERAAASGEKAKKETEAKNAAETKASPSFAAGLAPDMAFSRYVDLRVAKIVKIERHPKAEKLYVESVDDGSGTERTIVSGLVPHYREDELLGKSVVLAYNLKTAKLRGLESRGMLLAASMPDGEEGKEIVEVLDASWASPGARVCVEGGEPPAESPAEIDIDGFFSVPLVMEGAEAKVGGKRLLVDGKPLRAERAVNGKIG
jgi:methionyl-tRNA synthetase